MSFPRTLTITLLTLLLPIHAAEISTDAGLSWHPQPSEEATALLFFSKPHALHARSPDAHTRTTPSCASHILVSWLDSPSGEAWGLSWRRAQPCLPPTSTISIASAFSSPPELRPRWAAYRYAASAADIAAAESSSAPRKPWWKMPGNYGLVLAAFVIFALGHGIYLGATAVVEDEEAELRRRREEELRKLRLLATAAPVGAITVENGRARKRKGKGKGKGKKGGSSGAAVEK